MSLSDNPAAPSSRPAGYDAGTLGKPSSTPTPPLPDGGVLGRTGPIADGGVLGRSGPPSDSFHSSPTSSRRSPGASFMERGGPISPRRDSSEALEGFPLAVLRELTKYLSEPNARALLLASASAAGVGVSALKPSLLSVVVSQVVKTFDVFGLGPDAKSKCLFNLRSLSHTTLVQNEVVVPIVQEGDIVTARESGKQMCVSLNFSEVSYVKVATAISELARNIVKYAGEGSITVRVIPGQRRGVEVVATDRGPGIPDIDAVLSPRYRSRSGMGIGLRGTRKVMDHFEIRSQPGRGTTVTIRKYQD